MSIHQKLCRPVAGLSSLVLVVGSAFITTATSEFAVTAVAAGPCVDGAHTGDDPLMPWSGNGGYDAKHYDIDLTFTPATSGTGATPASIDATTTITAATAGNPLCSFSLDMLGLTVTSVMVDGATAAFSRIQDTGTSMYKLVVNPAIPVSGNFTVAVAYNGQPQQFAFQGAYNFPSGWIPNRTITLGGTTYPADGGGVGLGEPTGAFAWYPVNAAVYDKASYTTHLTVPNDMQAVAIGALQSKTPVGTGQTRWTWDEPDPVTSYLTIAAIGQYAHFTDTHTTPGGTTVPIDVYVDAALDAATAGHAHYIDLLKQLLDWGEANFGPYQPAVAGYIMKSIAVNYALEIYGKPFYTSDWGDSTFIHEFAHQWFGDAVTTASWADLWLNEGFATYVPWLWYEDHGGLTVNQQAMNTYNGSSPTASLWSVAPAAMTSQSQLFGDWNYTGGGLALAALRQGIGPDLMKQLLQQWFAAHVGGSGTTIEFITLAEQVTGADLSQWAHDWLYTTGKPAAWPVALSYLPVSDAPLAMYRIFSPVTGEHFYTSSVGEASANVNSGAWRYEGVGWYAPSSGTPVYRLAAIPGSGSAGHLFTTSVKERDAALVSVNPAGQPYWKCETGVGMPACVGWYSGGSVPVFRAFHPGSGQHNYTTDTNEQRVITTQQGWMDEGVGWYGVQKGNPGAPMPV